MSPSGQKIIRFVAYIRVSSKCQASEGMSLEGQLDAIRGYAHAVEGSLAAIYEDVAPAGGPPSERPDLIAAIRHARDMDANILVTAVDRLARNLLVLDLLRNAGVRVWVVGTGPLSSRELEKHLRDARRVLADIRTRAEQSHASKKGKRQSVVVPDDPDARRRGSITQSVRAQDRDRFMFRHFEAHPELREMTHADKAAHLNSIGLLNQTSRKSAVPWTRESAKKIWHRYVRHVEAEREMDQGEP